MTPLVRISALLALLAGSAAVLWYQAAEPEPPAVDSAALPTGPRLTAGSRPLPAPATLPILGGRGDRKRIIYLDESYHGTFAASASVSALMPLKDMFQSNIFTAAIPTPNLAKCPEGVSAADFALSCANALEEQARSGDVAAFIVEPILGSAGVIIPPVAYFDRIRAICDQ